MALRWLRPAAALVAVAAAAAPAVEYMPALDAVRQGLSSSAHRGTFKPRATPEQLRAVHERARSSAQKPEPDAVPGIYVGHRDGRADGVVYVDEVIGRTETFSFALTVEPDGRIRRIDVLRYQEPVGDEVASRPFLDQFAGRGPDDPLRLKREIVNIGGATMSCEGLTERVRWLLDYHALVVAPALPAWVAAAPGGAPTPAEPEARDRGPGIGHAALVERAAVLGTVTLAIRIRGGNLEAATTLADALAARAEALDLVVNGWRPESEVSRLNTAGGGKASPALLDCLRAARAAHDATGGRFDPTVRPLIDLWAQAVKDQVEPTVAAMTAARAAIGFGRVALGDDGEVRLPAGVRLDLGGIAKGWLIDRLVAESVAALGSGHTLELDFGRSSRAVAAPAGATTDPVTHVELEDPVRPGSMRSVLPLRPGQAFGSSSSESRLFRIGDQERSHLIDPLSGEPGPRRRAASVVAASAAVADGLDTALCLMPAPEGLALCARLGVEAELWDGERFHATPGWPGRPIDAGR